MKALLSIKPEFAEAIFNGKKRFEYRKVIFKEKVKYIQVYVTKPVGKIIGEFEIGEIVKDNQSGNQLHPNRGVDMKRGRAGEWFENEEVAGFLRADGSVFVCFVKNAMETVAGGFQFELPEADGYEEDFFT